MAHPDQLHPGSEEEKKQAPQPAPLHTHEHASGNEHSGDHGHAHDHTHEHAGGHEHAHHHASDHAYAHEQEHDHDHGAGHSHDHDHDHAHEHAGLLGQLRHFFQPHAHDHSIYIRDAALANSIGIRAVKISLAGLLVTAVFQLFVVYFSGSVALLADTVHNFSDALTALPLWLAFALASLPRNRRYTYGYGRAEDLAGVLIVLMIFGSAMVVFYESIQKLIHFQPMQNIGWVAAASVVGFMGNEMVALFRIRVGRQIGSAALVADGMHARTDGLTSLAVLVGAIGAALGFPILDPLIGFVVGIAILVIVWGAARDMWLHIMDAADPEVVEMITRTAAAVEGVLSVHDVHLRWLGHQQRGEIHIEVNCHLSTERSHLIAENVRCQLFSLVPSLTEVSVHVDPCECDAQVDYHPSAHCLQPTVHV